MVRKTLTSAFNRSNNEAGGTRSGATGLKTDLSAIEKKLQKLKKKDPILFDSVKKKILQIAALDETEIRHFKNLRYGLKTYKRAHVGSFVLMFKVERGLVIFDRFVHHDDAY